VIFLDHRDLNSTHMTPVWRTKHRGNQFTLTWWHVDDIKISHKDPKEVSRVIEWLKRIYGDNIHVSRELVHEYLPRNDSRQLDKG
jgi:hypothetical protein